ncbi:MAG TPA: trigger factor [Bacillota bacterium]
MQFNLEKLEKNLVSIEATVSVEEIEEAIAKAYKKVVKKVNLPGFRKGNIPRHILEAHFGKEVFYEDALDIIVPKAYLEALNEFKLEPIDNPQFEVVEPLDAAKPFVFKAKVELLPEVKLGQYKNLQVEKKQVQITPEDIEKQLKVLQERHTELVLSDKEELEKGDFAVIDFEGYIDGKPFTGGAAQAYTLEIGSETFIPGFEDQLIGMKTGTEREITVTFPADYQNSELAGKEAVFKVALKEIKVKEIPELDDEFAKSVGNFENLDELRKDIETKITSMAELEAENVYSEAVIQKAVSNSEVEIPEIMIKQEIEQMMHRFERNLAHQGLNLEKYLEYSKKTREDVLEEFRPEAEKQVKTDLVLNSIAKQENIEVSEAEIDDKVRELAERYQYKNPEKLKQELTSQGRLAQIKQAIILEKTADFLKESAVPLISQ